VKETLDQAVDRAIAKLPHRRILAAEGRSFEVQSLLPVSSWRPLEAEWWSGKEVYVIGDDPHGNLFLRHCDGTVRFWDFTRGRDEVIAPSVRDFLSRLHG
jgi:hypothetical protein